MHICVCIHIGILFQAVVTGRGATDAKINVYVTLQRTVMSSSKKRELLLSPKQGLPHNIQISPLQIMVKSVCWSPHIPLSCWDSPGRSQQFTRHVKTYYLMLSDTLAQKWWLLAQMQQVQRVFFWLCFNIDVSVHRKNEVKGMPPRFTFILLFSS